MSSKEEAKRQVLKYLMNDGIWSTTLNPRTSKTCGANVIESWIADINIHPSSMVFRRPAWEEIAILLSKLLKDEKSINNCV
jgi:hypothetical protein